MSQIRGLGRVPAGVRYMVASAFFFSVMSLFVKLAGRRLHTSEIVFARSVVSLLLAYAMLRRRGLHPWGSHRRLLVLRGLLGFSALLCFFYAVTHLPLADATVIHFTNPVFTMVLASLLLHEAAGWREAAGLVVSLTGVILVARPSFLFGGLASDLDMFAVGVALAGAILSALAYTVVRRLREIEHHLVVVFYFPLVATPASVPIMVPHAVWPTPTELVWLLAVGVVTQIAQIFLTKGLHAQPAGRAMSLGYVQIVFAAVWGVVVFGEAPTALTVLGAALVVGGMFVVSSRTNSRGT